jgi:mono/diheme cytochrome c family protein
VAALLASANEHCAAALHHINGLVVSTRSQVIAITMGSSYQPNRLHNMDSLLSLIGENPLAAAAILTIGLAVASAIGGAIIFALNKGLTSYFKASVDEKKVEAFETGFFKQATTPGKGMAANIEPFVISAVGFLLFLALAGFTLLQVPGPAQAQKETEVKAAGMPIEGDYTQIVAELPAGNADGGLAVYNGKGCSGCHSLEDKRLVGPTFKGVYTTAATRMPNLGPKEYLYKSIVAPNSYLVDSYQGNLMPATYAQTLTPQEMADVLAWLERDQK